jgi:hypothetical protein
MTDVSLGGGKKNAGATPEQQKQKMIYLDIPTAITMIIELGDSKNIKKYSDPIIANIKKSMNNKELKKILCLMFGVKTAKKFQKLKPQEFEIMTGTFGDIWGLKK